MGTMSSAVALETSGHSDAEIIRQVLEGNTAMFELLMRRYNERVYRAARSIVRDEQEAEDVMQQAYVNAFTHLRQFNGSAQFSTWLTKIALNEALARVRRRGRYETFDEDLSNVEPFMSSNPAPNPERQAFAEELRRLLEWAIDTLPDGMREVFVLRDVEGLSTSEVAESLGVSDDVVKTRLSRGRAALRRVLRERTGARSGSLPILPAAVRPRRRAGSRPHCRTTRLIQRSSTPPDAATRPASASAVLPRLERTGPGRSRGISEVALSASRVAKTRPAAQRACTAGGAAGRTNDGPAQGAVDS